MYAEYTMYTICTLYTVYTAYAVYTMYTVYTVYTMYTMYTVYTMYVYSVFNLYTLCTMHYQNTSIMSTKIQPLCTLKTPSDIALYAPFNYGSYPQRFVFLIYVFTNILITRATRGPQT